MEQVIDRCAGLDVHNHTVAACVRVPGNGRRRDQHVQTFGTTTAELLGLHDWLAAHQVTHVAMESTGVYWKPVYYALEDTFTLVLVNPAHMRNVPGRKTDVQDCVWIAQLLECGLLRGSFVPPPAIRDLRDLTRYRKSLIQERTRAANRLHKVLQEAGVKLASVASDVLGVSGRAMLEALVQGTTDPYVLADLACGRLRAKLQALRTALAGRFRPHHAFLVGQLVSHLDYLEDASDTVSAKIAETLCPFTEAIARLDTIPGVNRQHRRSHCGGDRGQHAAIPQCGAFGELGRTLSGSPRDCRQASVGQNPQGEYLVAHGADRSRLSGDPGQRDGAGGPLSSGDAASGA